MSKLKRLRMRIICSSKIRFSQERPKISFIKTNRLSGKIISLLPKVTRWTWLIDWKSICQSRSRLQLSVWRRSRRRQNESVKVISKRKILSNNLRLRKRTWEGAPLDSGILQNPRQITEKNPWRCCKAPWRWCPGRQELGKVPSLSPHPQLASVRQAHFCYLPFQPGKKRGIKRARFRIEHSRLEPGCPITPTPLRSMINLAMAPLNHSTQMMRWRIRPLRSQWWLIKRMSRKHSRKTRHSSQARLDFWAPSIGSAFSTTPPLSKLSGPRASWSASQDWNRSCRTSVVVDLTGSYFSMLISRLSKRFASICTSQR